MEEKHPTLDGEPLVRTHSTDPAEEGQPADASELLADCVARLAEGVDTQDLVAHVVGKLVRQVGADHAYLLRYRPADHTLRLELWHDGRRPRWGMSGDEISGFDAPFPADLTPALEVMCRERRMFTPARLATALGQNVSFDGCVWPRAEAYHRRFGVSDSAFAALIARGRLIGSLHVQFTGERMSSEADEGLFLSMAGLVAVAFGLDGPADAPSGTSAVRGQVADERFVELVRATDLLRAIGRDLIELRTSDDVIARFVRQVVVIARAPAAAVLQRVDPSGTEFAFSTCYIRDRDVILPAAQVISGEVEQEMRRVSRMDPTGDFARLASGFVVSRRPEDMRSGGLPLLADEMDRHGCRWMHEFPYRVGGEVEGYLGFRSDDDRELTAVEREMVAALAAQAGVALELTRAAGRAKEAAVAREREKAAEDRCEELIRANESIRSFGREVVTLRSADEILGHYIRQVAAVTRAHSASALTRVDPTGVEFAFSDSYLREIDAILPTEQILGRDVVDEFRRVGRGDPAGYFAPLGAGQDMVRNLADLAAGGLKRFHEHMDFQGVGKIYEFPYRVGGEVAGFVSLAFCGDQELTSMECEVVAALTTQVGVALELARVAGQAKEAAVAREREAAAERRVVELERTNAALQQVLDAFSADADFDRVLGRILTSVSEWIGSEYAALWVLDPADRKLGLRLVYDHGAVVSGPDSGHPNAHAPIPYDDPHLAEANELTRGGPHWLDVTNERVFTKAHREVLAAAGVKRLLRIGLVVGEETVGSVTVRSWAAGGPTPDRFAVAQTLAQQAALAIHLERLAAAGRLAAVADERNRMAREIHDTLAQCFTGIFVQLQAAREFFATKPDVTQACVRRAEGLARDGLREARRSVAALQPDADEYKDLATALRRLVGRATSATGTKTEVGVQGIEYPLPDDAGLNLYRIAQEALGNAQRYAGARGIRLQVEFGPDAVTLAIIDDGRGFEPAAVPADAGYGLAGMRHRAERLGGTFELTSAPGLGTAIRVLIPIDHSARGRQA